MTRFQGIDWSTHADFNVAPAPFLDNSFLVAATRGGLLVFLRHGFFSYSGERLTFTQACRRERYELVGLCASFPVIFNARCFLFLETS